MWKLGMRHSEPILRPPLTWPTGLSHSKPILRPPLTWQLGLDDFDWGGPLNSTQRQEHVLKSTWDMKPNDMR